MSGGPFAQLCHHTRAAKRLYAIQLGKMLQNESEGAADRLVPYFKAKHVFWEGVVLSDLPLMWASPRDLAKYGVRDGDLLVSEGGDVGRAAVVQAPLGASIIQNALHRVRSSLSDVRFLCYALRVIHGSGWLDVLCNRATIAHLTGEKLGDLRIPAAPLSTQKAIADFLDRKTAAIDALVGEKRKLLALLAEKRAALITHAVTKGLDPNVPMKDSRIPSLGCVPDHWEVLQNKVLVREATDLSTSGEEELLTVSHITGVTPRYQKEVTMFLAATHIGYKRVRPGDLIINTMWAWMGALGVASHHGIVSPAYGVYRFDQARMCPEFFDHFYRTPQYVCEMTRYSRGVWSSRLRLYPESFLSLLVPVPPVEEQHSIVRFIANEVGRVPEVIQRLKGSINRLQEYRQALITAAVTGQLHVGGVV